MFGNKWVKLVIGAGTVGGLVMLGSGLARTHASTHAPLFPELSPDANAALSGDKMLHVALCRLGSYSSGDPEAHTKLLKSVARVVATSPTPDTAELRYAEGHVQVVKRCMARLREATSTRTHNSTEVMEEFDELASAVLGVCDDKLFNLHQAYTPI